MESDLLENLVARAFLPFHFYMVFSSLLAETLTEANMTSNFLLNRTFVIRKYKTKVDSSFKYVDTNRSVKSQHHVHDLAIIEHLPTKKSKVDSFFKYVDTKRGF